MSDRIPGYKSALVTYPNEGSKLLEVPLTFPASGALPVMDLFEEMALNDIATIQSVFIDNSDNTSAFELRFPGMREGYKIVVQPYHQGWFPVAAPHGALRFSAVSQAEDTRTIIFANVCMPYFEWGPSDGILVTPALVVAPVDLSQVGDGSSLLVALDPADPTKIYRMQITFDNPCTIKFETTTGTDLTGPITIFAGGSITWQAGGTPWISSPVGEGIQITFTNTGGATIGAGGVIGYTQS